jgi:hypothetical protein
MSPLQFLVRTYNDETLPVSTRLEAASLAAPYLHCRLHAFPMAQQPVVDESGVPTLELHPVTASPGTTIINVHAVPSGTFIDGDNQDPIDTSDVAPALAPAAPKGADAIDADATGATAATT